MVYVGFYFSTNTPNEASREHGRDKSQRLDDPEALDTKSDKLVDPAVFRVIGELYLNVPKEHKYRFYILMLTLLACTGRRFSEISLLPNQQLSSDEEGLPISNTFRGRQVVVTFSHLSVDFTCRQK